MVQAYAAICDVVIDNLPGPVCRRVRAGHYGKVRGRAHDGYGAATKEKIFGWRVHLVYTTSGVPVACVLLPASYHDLIPLHELRYGLPAETMGMLRLRAGTKVGFDLRVSASVLALTALPSTSNHGHMLRLGVQFGNNIEARTTFYVTIIDKGNDRVLCR